MDNSLLIVVLLLVIVLSRFNIAFLNGQHHVLAPDTYYYAGVNVGRDWISGTVNQAYRLLSGLPMEFKVGYGYGFTIPTAWLLSFLTALGICSSANHLGCQFVTYNILVTVSIAGLIVLVPLLIRKHQRRWTGLLFLTAFLLGVPGGRGIEAGNLDIVLSVLYGIVLYLQRILLNSKKQSRWIVFLLGIISALMLQTKIFVLPLIIVLLICSAEPLLFIISLLAGFVLISVIPVFYGVSISPLQVWWAAQKEMAPFTQGLYTSYTYGNNNTRAMIGSIYFALPGLRLNQALRYMLISLGGGLLFLGILFLPLYRFKTALIKRLKSFKIKDRLQYPFFIFLNIYAMAVIVLWPVTAYDYRFFYFIPLIFVLLDIADTSRLKQLTALSISALLIRSLFFPHARFLNIFTILFFLFLLMSAVTLFTSNKGRLK